jgi:hypothetical protein
VPEKEATARIKINRLLEAAGWRFLPDGDQASNIRLEPSVTITSSDSAAVGDDGMKIDCMFFERFEDTVRESLEKVFGLILRFKTKEELPKEEFAEFVADRKPEEAAALPAIKHDFKAYIINGRVRAIIDRREYTDLATNPVLSTRDFRAVPPKYRTPVPEYVKDYVPLNQFTA